MTRHTGYIAILLGILLANISYCQQNHIPVIQYGHGCPEISVPMDSMVTSSEILSGLFEQGFPYAILDSVNNSAGDTVLYQVDCGPLFRHAQISWKGPMVEELQATQNTTRVYPWRAVTTMRKEILSDLANEGYPYTRLYTDARAIRQDTLFLEYSLDTIRRIYVQDVQWEGDFSMNRSLFSKMTGIAENQVFSIDRIHRSREIIQQWDFAELRGIEYDFNPFGVDLIYEIESSQPSRFDLLIGLVPSNRPNKQYEITGNGYLDVRNQLRMGERIYLKFDKYANSSQAFDVRFDFPYLPLIRSGVLAEGLIDRRDSTVLDVHGKIGVQYRWKPSLKYAVFLQRDQSRIISVNTNRLINTGLLPEELDYNFSAAGLSLTYHRLDHFINPRKGSVLSGTITGGVRKLVWNGQILAIELPAERTSFQNQYDSLTQSTVKSEIDLIWDQFIPIGLYSTFRFRAMAGLTWSSAELYQNEYRRLGGFQDFRGFPENSFLADSYSVLTAEYRFLFGAESNVYAFTDFGFLHHPVNQMAWNFPYSVGIGLNLGTKAGVFGISYAVGGQRNIPLSLDQSRVNFGLMVNY